MQLSTTASDAKTNSSVNLVTNSSKPTKLYVIDMKSSVPFYDEYTRFDNTLTPEQRLRFANHRITFDNMTGHVWGSPCKKGETIWSQAGIDPNNSKCIRIVGAAELMTVDVDSNGFLYIDLVEHGCDSVAAAAVANHATVPSTDTPLVSITPTPVLPTNTNL